MITFDELMPKINKLALHYYRKNPWEDLQDLQQQALLTALEVYKKYQDRFDEARNPTGYIRLAVDHALRDYVLKDKSPVSIPTRPTREWFLKNPLHRAGARLSYTAAFDEEKTATAEAGSRRLGVRIRIYKALEQEHPSRPGFDHDAWAALVRNRVVTLCQTLDPLVTKAVVSVVLDVKTPEEAEKTYKIPAKTIRRMVQVKSQWIRQDPEIRRLYAIVEAADQPMFVG